MHVLACNGSFDNPGVSIKCFQWCNGTGMVQFISINVLGYSNGSERSFAPSAYDFICCHFCFEVVTIPLYLIFQCCLLRVFLNFPGIEWRAKGMTTFAVGSATDEAVVTHLPLRLLTSLSLYSWGEVSSRCVVGNQNVVGRVRKF